MSESARVALEIDVFEKVGQKALALRDLMPLQLVTVILQEFNELEYLSNLTGRYRLLKAVDGMPLDENTPLANQLRDGEHLTLSEVEMPLPEGTSRPSQPIYLRELSMGITFPVSWQPAIIGRTSENLPNNDRVAVDLKTLPTGLRVSRRHAMLTEAGDCYFIENLSNNPLLLIRAAPTQADPDNGDLGKTAVPVRLGSDSQQLYHGDILEFERSGITLKFVIRPDSGNAVTAGAGQATTQSPDDRYQGLVKEQLSA